MAMLSGKNGLIVGIANEHSGYARHFRAAGADLAITYVNAETEPYVRPLAEALTSDIFMPCDVTVPGQLDAVYERISKDWGRLDFVQHCIAYACKEDLHGRVVDCSAEGFALAMQVSVQSFLQMEKLSEPLMTAGSCLLAMSYYGADGGIISGTVEFRLKLRTWSEFVCEPRRLGIVVKPVIGQHRQNVEIVLKVLYFNGNDNLVASARCLQSIPEISHP